MHRSGERRHGERRLVRHEALRAACGGIVAIARGVSYLEGHAVAATRDGARVASVDVELRDRGAASSGCTSIRRPPARARAPPLVRRRGRNLVAVARCPSRRASAALRAEVPAPRVPRRSRRRPLWHAPLTVDTSGVYARRRERRARLCGVSCPTRRPTRCVADAGARAVGAGRPAARYRGDHRGRRCTRGLEAFGELEAANELGGALRATRSTRPRSGWHPELHNGSSSASRARPSQAPPPAAPRSPSSSSTSSYVDEGSTLASSGASSAVRPRASPSARRDCHSGASVGRRRPTRGAAHRGHGGHRASGIARRSRTPSTAVRGSRRGPSLNGGASTAQAPARSAAARPRRSRARPRGRGQGAFAARIRRDFSTRGLPPRLPRCARRRRGRHQGAGGRRRAAVIAAPGAPPQPAHEPDDQPGRAAPAAPGSGSRTRGGPRASRRGRVPQPASRARRPLAPRRRRPPHARASSCALSGCDPAAWASCAAVHATRAARSRRGARSETLRAIDACWARNSDSSEAARERRALEPKDCEAACAGAQHELPDGARTNKRRDARRHRDARQRSPQEVATYERRPRRRRRADAAFARSESAAGAGWRPARSARAAASALELRRARRAAGARGRFPRDARAPRRATSPFKASRTGEGDRQRVTRRRRGRRSPPRTGRGAPTPRRRARSREPTRRPAAI